MAVASDLKGKCFLCAERQRLFVELCTSFVSRKNEHPDSDSHPCAFEENEFEEVYELIKNKWTAANPGYVLQKNINDSSQLLCFDEIASNETCSDWQQFVEDISKHLLDGEKHILNHDEGKPVGTACGKSCVSFVHGEVCNGCISLIRQQAESESHPDCDVTQQLRVMQLLGGTNHHITSEQSPTPNLAVASTVDGGESCNGPMQHSVASETWEKSCTETTARCRASECDEKVESFAKSQHPEENGASQKANSNTCACETKHEDERQHLVATNTNLVAMGTDLVATDTDLVATDTDLVATDTDLVATDTDLVATDTDLVATDTDLVATNTNLVAMDTDLVAMDTDLVATDTDLVATNTNLVVADTDLVATDTDLVATNTNLVATDTDLVATDTDLVATNTNLVAMDTDLVATDTDLVATDTDLVATNTDLVATNTDLVSTDTNLLSSGAIFEGNCSEPVMVSYPESGCKVGGEGLEDITTAAATGRKYDLPTDKSNLGINSDSDHVSVCNKVNSTEAEVQLMEIVDFKNTFEFPTQSIEEVIVATDMDEEYKSPSEQIGLTTCIDHEHESKFTNQQMTTTSGCDDNSPSADITRKFMTRSNPDSERNICKENLQIRDPVAIDHDTQATLGENLTTNNYACENKFKNAAVNAPESTSFSATVEPSYNCKDLSDAVDSARQSAAFKDTSPYFTNGGVSNIENVNDNQQSPGIHGQFKKVIFNGNLNKLNPTVVNPPHAVEHQNGSTQNIVFTYAPTAPSSGSPVTSLGRKTILVVTSKRNIKSSPQSFKLETVLEKARTIGQDKSVDAVCQRNKSFSAAKGMIKASAEHANSNYEPGMHKQASTGCKIMCENNTRLTLNQLNQLLTMENQAHPNKKVMIKVVNKTQNDRFLPIHCATDTAVSSLTNGGCQVNRGQLLQRYHLVRHSHESLPQLCTAKHTQTPAMARIASIQQPPTVATCRNLHVKLRGQFPSKSVAIPFIPIKAPMKATTPSYRSKYQIQISGQNDKLNGELRSLAALAKETSKLKMKLSNGATGETLSHEHTPHHNGSLKVNKATRISTTPKKEQAQPSAETKTNSQTKLPKAKLKASPSKTPKTSDGKTEISQEQPSPSKAKWTPAVVERPVKVVKAARKRGHSKDVGMSEIVAKFVRTDNERDEKPIANKVKPRHNNVLARRAVNKAIPVPYEAHFLCITQTIATKGWKAYWYRRCRCAKGLTTSNRPKPKKSTPATNATSDSIAQKNKTSSSAEHANKSASGTAVEQGSSELSVLVTSKISGCMMKSSETETGCGEIEQNENKGSSVACDKKNTYGCSVKHDKISYDCPANAVHNNCVGSSTPVRNYGDGVVTLDAKTSGNSSDHVVQICSGSVNCSVKNLGHGSNCSTEHDKEGCSAVKCNAHKSGGDNTDVKSVSSDTFQNKSEICVKNATDCDDAELEETSNCSVKHDKSMKFNSESHDGGKDDLESSSVNSTQQVSMDEDAKSKPTTADAIRSRINCFKSLLDSINLNTSPSCSAVDANVSTKVEAEPFASPANCSCYTETCGSDFAVLPPDLDSSFTATDVGCDSDSSAVSTNSEEHVRPSASSHAHAVPTQSNTDSSLHVGVTRTDNPCTRQNHTIDDEVMKARMLKVAEAENHFMSSISDNLAKNVAMLFRPVVVARSKHDDMKDELLVEVVEPPSLSLFRDRKEIQHVLEDRAMERRKEWNALLAKPHDAENDTDVRRCRAKQSDLDLLWSFGKPAKYFEKVRQKPQINSSRTRNHNIHVKQSLRASKNKLITIAHHRRPFSSIHKKSLLYSKSKFRKHSSLGVSCSTVSRLEEGWRQRATVWGEQVCASSGRIDHNYGAVAIRDEQLHFALSALTSFTFSSKCVRKKGRSPVLLISRKCLETDTSTDSCDGVSGKSGELRCGGKAKIKLKLRSNKNIASRKPGGHHGYKNMRVKVEEATHACGLPAYLVSNRRYHNSTSMTCHWNQVKQSAESSCSSLDRSTSDDGSISPQHSPPPRQDVEPCFSDAAVDVNATTVSDTSLQYCDITSGDSDAITERYYLATERSEVISNVGTEDYKNDVMSVSSVHTGVDDISTWGDETSSNKPPSVQLQAAVVEADVATKSPELQSASNSHFLEIAGDSPRPFANESITGFLGEKCKTNFRQWEPSGYHQASPNSADVKSQSHHCSYASGSLEKLLRTLDGYLIDSLEPYLVSSAWMSPEQLTDLLKREHKPRVLSRANSLQDDSLLSSPEVVRGATPDFEKVAVEMSPMPGFAPSPDTPSPDTPPTEAHHSPPLPSASSPVTSPGREIFRTHHSLDGSYWSHSDVTDVRRFLRARQKRKAAEDGVTDDVTDDITGDNNDHDRSFMSESEQSFRQLPTTEESVRRPRGPKRKRLGRVKYAQVDAKQLVEVVKHQVNNLKPHQLQESDDKQASELFRCDVDITGVHKWMLESTIAPLVRGLRATTIRRADAARVRSRPSTGGRSGSADSTLTSCSDDSRSRSRQPRPKLSRKRPQDDEDEEEFDSEFHQLRQRLFLLRHPDYHGNLGHGNLGHGNLGHGNPGHGNLGPGNPGHGNQVQQHGPTHHRDRAGTRLLRLDALSLHKFNSAHLTTDLLKHCDVSQRDNSRRDKRRRLDGKLDKRCRHHREGCADDDQRRRNPAPRLEPETSHVKSNGAAVTSLCPHDVARQIGHVASHRAIQHSTPPVADSTRRVPSLISPLSQSPVAHLTPNLSRPPQPNHLNLSRPPNLSQPPPNPSRLPQLNRSQPQPNMARSPQPKVKVSSHGRIITPSYRIRDIQELTSPRDHKPTPPKPPTLASRYAKPAPSNRSNLIKHKTTQQFEPKRSFLLSKVEVRTPKVEIRIPKLDTATASRGPRFINRHSTAGSFLKRVLESGGAGYS